MERNEGLVLYGLVREFEDSPEEADRSGVGDPSSLEIVVPREQPRTATVEEASASEISCMCLQLAVPKK